MKIQGGNNGPLRPERARDVHGLPVDQRDRANERPPSQIETYDRVELSDAGRAKSSKLEPTTAGEKGRLAEIRRRLRTGAYDADIVVSEVAQRILDSGDV